MRGLLLLLTLLSLRANGGAANSSLLQRTKCFFTSSTPICAALAKTTTSCTSNTNNSNDATLDAHKECRNLLQGYDLLGNILGGQGHSWVLPYLRLLTFSPRPVDEVTQLVRRMSTSGAERRRQLRELRKLSPDVSAKFVPTKAERDNPFGKAIGNVMAYSIVGDLIDRTTDFDLNWVLLQMSTTRMIAATARAMMGFEVNEERKRWLAEVAEEYEDVRKELKEVIKLYIRGEGSASSSVGR